MWSWFYRFFPSNIHNPPTHSLDTFRNITADNKGAITFRCIYASKSISGTYLGKGLCQSVTDTFRFSVCLLTVTERPWMSYMRNQKYTMKIEVIALRKHICFLRAMTSIFIVYFWLRIYDIHGRSVTVKRHTENLKVSVTDWHKPLPR